MKIMLIVLGVLAAPTVAAAANGPIAKVNGMCPTGMITCEEWCKRYRPQYLSDCLEQHPTRSCAVQFRNIGGKQACLPNSPPTN